MLPLYAVWVRSTNRDDEIILDKWAEVVEPSDAFTVKAAMLSHARQLFTDPKWLDERRFFAIEDEGMYIWELMEYDPTREEIDFD